MTNGSDQPPAPAPQRPPANRSAVGAGQPANLADLLERVLDKGIVIAGDVTLSLGTIELLTLRIRLVVASVDKAQEIGIDWWKSDPGLSSQARRDNLEDRIRRLESMVGGDGKEIGDENESTGLEDRLKRLEANLGEKGPDEARDEA